jgi:hypothetical protein
VLERRARLGDPELVRRARVSLILMLSAACSTSSKPPTGAAGAAGIVGTAGTAGTAGIAGTAGGGSGGGAGTTSSGTGGAGGTTGVAGDGGAGAGGATGAAGAGTTGAAGGGSAGSGSDGGASDGPAGARNLSTDRTLFLGASRCAQANVQLCEDFESGTLDTATWTTLGGKPVIDGVQAARGSKALHLTIMGNGQSAIRETKTFREPNDTYYGRVFVYFASLPTQATGFDYAHWTMIAASGTQVMGEIRVSGQMQNGKSLWGVGTDNRVDPNGTGDWTNSDNDPSGKPVAVPTGKWMCIEWMHKGDTNETRFWWDGVEHPSLYTMPTTPHGGNPNEPYILPQFTSVWLGWQEYQTTTETFELWLDEIAIDKDRIGCVL